MTYQNDPNLNRAINARRDGLHPRNDTPMWIAGAAALLLVFGIIAWSISNRSEVAMNAPRTPVTETRTTTGSGATSPIPNTATKTDIEPAPGPRVPTSR